MSVPPTSRLVMNTAQGWPMQWYLDLLYLNHGHYFFNTVGPGFIIRYELRDRSGKVVEGQLPDTKDQWPRLRYHRHFMLADQAGMPSDDEQLSAYWLRKYLDAYARQLLRANENAETVTVQRFVHYPLPLDLARQGRKMTDPESYERAGQPVTLRRSDVMPANGDQTQVWQNGRVDTANRWMGGAR